MNLLMNVLVVMVFMRGLRAAFSGKRANASRASSVGGTYTLLIDNIAKVLITIEASKLDNITAPRRINSDKLLDLRLDTLEESTTFTITVEYRVVKVTKIAIFKQVCRSEYIMGLP